MSDQDDCDNDMSSTPLIDGDIERLLSGVGVLDPELQQLTGFVDSMRARRSATRQGDEVTRLVAKAAAMARESRPMPTVRLVTPRRRRSFRLAPLGVALIGILVLGMSSVAIAADGSAPGDALYGVDRILENLGIGDGGINERITESGDLMVHGAPLDALVHLDESLADADEEVTERVSERVQIHLDLAQNMINPNSVDAQSRVASILGFLEANKGKGTGLDGNEFGQGVSDNATNDTEEPEDTETSESPGNGNQGQGQGQGNDNQGQGQGNDNQGQGQGNDNQGQGRGNGGS